MKNREQWYKNRRRLIRLVKKIYQPLKFRSGHPKTLLFITGCQRSGTTLMLVKILELDLNTKVYGEFSRLSASDPRKIRLDPLHSVRAVTERDKAGLIVLKPLVESQHILRLLNYFEGSKALWMYRHYGDAALSGVRKFGAGRCIDRLGAVIRNRPGDWRAERVPEDVRETVRKHFSQGMNPHDAAALFWFVRNNFFFELNLEEQPNVRLCRYESLVTNPLETMRTVYRFAGQDFPGKRIIREVSAASVGKGKDISLSPDTDLLCRNLLERLDEIHASSAD